MKVLDLFCGRGGWSKGFEGHERTGVDIKNIGYPYRFIKADLFDWEPDQCYDVVLASPPCTHFSQVVLNWTGKSNPTKGLDLVWRTFHLIDKIKPKYYAIENVPGLASFIGPPSRIVRYGKNVHSKQAYIWSNIKAGRIAAINRTMTRKAFRQSNPKLAEIPIELSRAYSKAVQSSLFMRMEA